MYFCWHIYSYEEFQLRLEQYNVLESVYHRKMIADDKIFHLSLVVFPSL